MNRNSLAPLLILFMLIFINISSAQESQPKIIPQDIQMLLDKNLCSTCHKIDEKFVGPSYQALANKDHTMEEIAALIINPEPDNWPGYPPMVAMPYLNKSEVEKIASWIYTLGKQETEKSNE